MAETEQPPRLVPGIHHVIYPALVESQQREVLAFPDTQEANVLTIIKRPDGWAIAVVEIRDLPAIYQSEPQDPTSFAP